MGPVSAEAHGLASYRWPHIDLRITGIIGRIALCQYFLHHVRRFDTRQLGIQSLMLVGEAFVVDAKQVQNRRLVVPDVDRVFDDVVGEVVRFAVNHAAFDAAAGHP